MGEEGEKAEKSTKNHAGGGHDRQDAYLYGHPSGPKKRYRSPGDFFPHLFWLATDEAGDTENCSCKVCTPEELLEDEPTSQEAQQASQMMGDEQDDAAQAKPQVTGKHPVVEIPQRQPSQDLSAAKQPPPSTALTQRTVAPQNTQPSSLADTLSRPKSLDQQVDSSYGRFMFRPGEITWFNRGQAWGLGVITRRYVLNNAAQQEVRAYVVQPLSHPLSHPPQVVITQDDHLRPWLAWSPPPFTNALLNNTSVTYDSADWQGIMNKRYGEGDAEVDGSILAARAIDGSYTLFDLSSKTKAEAGAEELHWNGMYLGAEKVWVGEPVRLRPGSGTDVMVVVDIVERIQEPSAGAAARTNVYITGDIYTFVGSPHGQQPPSDRHLPFRMREDLRFRNSITFPAKQVTSYWKLVQQFCRLDISQLKGRWYESSLLIPLLDPTFSDHFRRGEIGDAGLYMNARGDGNGAEPRSADVRKPERRDALGRAVPPSTRIVEGIEPPTPEELPAAAVKPQTDEQPQPHPQQHDSVMQDPVESGALEEFMNLDGMEHEGVPGFGPEYAPQEGAGRMFF